MKKTLAILLALIVLSLSAVSVAAATDGINGANWLSALDDSLPITAINMPGTHDSAARYVNFSSLARTQSLSIPQQLCSGVRYFDMRLNVKGKKIVAYHSVIPCKKSIGLFAPDITANDIVSDCKSFLEQNPGETVLFLLRQEGLTRDKEFFGKFYDDIIAPSPELWFTENRIPTLGEVRGKIVLLRSCELDASRFETANSGINFEDYPYISSTDTDNFRFKAIEEADGEIVGYMYVQDSYKVEGEKKTKTIASFFDDNLSENHFNICCTNANNLKNPYANAKHINAFLSSYDFKAGSVYGIVSMDFATPELCERIYMTNLPLMTSTPNAANITEYGESYGFLGELMLKIRDFFLRLTLI